MKTFNCDACGALVFFQNIKCVKCGHALGFLPDIMDLAALEAKPDGRWQSLAKASSGGLYRACANGRDHAICNWFVPDREPDDFCVACHLNLMVPNLENPGNHANWHKAELAKRRLIYSLRQLSLSTEGEPAKGIPGLRFRFLAESPGSGPILTGHEDGVITLNIAEADDVERERRRTEFHGPQRTLIGHFRHECGHYYWDVLIKGSPLLQEFRRLFGDEQADYADALRTYYANGPSPDWASRCVTAYASAHPWEDWAETWAHYLHMVDSLETAAGVGLSLHPRHPAASTISAEPERALEAGVAFDTMLAHWIPLTHALNSLNRGQGLPDLYPFVLSDPVVGKLGFIHEVVARCKQRATNASPGAQLVTSSRSDFAPTAPMDVLRPDAMAGEESLTRESQPA